MNKYGNFKVGDIVFHKWLSSINNWEVLQIIKIGDDEIKNNYCSNIKYTCELLCTSNNSYSFRFRRGFDFFLYNSTVYHNCVKLDKNHWKEELMAKVI